MGITNSSMRVATSRAGLYVTAYNFCLGGYFPSLPENCYRDIPLGATGTYVCQNQLSKTDRNGCLLLTQYNLAIVVEKAKSMREMEFNSSLIPMELILFWSGPNGSNEWEKA